MAMPSMPNPCPLLQEGLALGAPEHKGFVVVWNWIVGVFRKARDYFVLSINGRTGCVEIVAGLGIDVSTSGKTVTISLGDSENYDDGDNGNTGGGSDDGGGGVSGNGGGDAESDVGDVAEVGAGGGSGGGGGSSGGGGATGGIFAWDESTLTMGPGGVMVGRKWVSATGVGSGKADALYQVKITLTATGASAEVVSGVSLGQAPSGNISYIPIYVISGGKISIDYRGAFVVPAYE